MTTQLHFKEFSFSCEITADNIEMLIDDCYEDLSETDDAATRFNMIDDIAKLERHMAKLHKGHESL